MTIELGNKIRDKVTGLEGIATARCDFLNGCQRFIMQPPLDKDGKMVEERWFDVGQLELVDSGITEKIEPRSTGGPTTSTPPRGAR